MAASAFFSLAPLLRGEGGETARSTSYLRLQVADRYYL